MSSSPMFVFLGNFEKWISSHLTDFVLQATPTQPLPSPPCSKQTISKWIEYQPKSNKKYPLYTVFQVLEVLLIKKFKIQPLDLLLLVIFISFYISRYHLPQIFKTSFSIIWKKIFVTNLPYLTDSPKPPSPTHLTAKIH